MNLIYFPSCILTVRFFTYKRKKTNDIGFPDPGYTRVNSGTTRKVVYEVIGAGIYAIIICMHIVPIVVPVKNRSVTGDSFTN